MRSVIKHALRQMYDWLLVRQNISAKKSLLQGPSGPGGSSDLSENRHKTEQIAQCHWNTSPHFK